MSKTYSFSTIRKKIREFGKKINAPSHLLSVRSTGDGFGNPHIEIGKNEYFYVVTERNMEFERRKTNNFDKLLYWLLSDIVFIMASKFELENRNPDEDSRRQLFAKEINLMEKIDPKFVKWKKEEISKILANNPYEDEQ